MKNQIRLRSYIVGFLASLTLTLVAYVFVARHVHSHHLIYSDNFLVGLVVILAIVQFFVQMIFFLHLGTESKPKWNLLTFGFMVGIVLILVLGSLWIMNHLDYNMHGKQTNGYIIQDEGFGHH